MAGSIADALEKLSSSIEPLIANNGVFWFICYALGVAMALRTLYKLKAHADNPSHNPLAGVVTTFFVTAALLSLPSVMDAVRNTLALKEIGSSSLSYVKEGAGASGAERAIYIYAAFFGYIAFARGVLILNKLGEPSKRGDELHRGITHLVGGVMATNLAEIIAELKQLFL